MRIGRTQVLTWTAAAFLLLASSARTQDSPEAASPEKADKGDEKTFIEEIVVTADKRERNLQDVSISITAYSADDLVLGGIDKIDQVAETTPGVYFETLGITRPFIFFRGTGTGAYDIGSDPSIAIFLDEVYLPRFTGIQFDLFDLERIEVLKGPQGTLFGRNTLGGAVSLVTRRPSNDFGGVASLEAGDFNLLSARLAVGGAAGSSEKLSYRLSAGLRQRDGYVKNLASGQRHNDEDSWGLRGQLRYAAGQNDLNVTVDWNEDDLAAWPESNVTDVVFLLFPPLYGTFPTSHDPYNQYYDTDGFQVREGGGVTLRWDRVASTMAFTSITALRSNDLVELHDLDSSFAATLNRYADDRTDTFSQEVRLASNGDGGLTWLAGLYYFDDDAFRRERWDVGADNVLVRVFNGGVPYAALDDVWVDTRSTAAFAQVAWELGPRATLSVGGRYSHDEKSSRREASHTAVFTPLLPAPYTAEVSKDWTSFDPTVALDFAPREDVLLYLRYSEGFKSGGFQPTVPVNEEIAETVFNPEEVRSFEAGLKSSWAGNRLRLNAAAFHVDYTNLQFLAATGLGPGGAPIVVITNAASSTTDGLEVELQAEPLPGLGLRIGYSYLDAVFDDYVDGAGVDHSGNRVIRTPEHMGHFVVQYYKALGEDRALVLRGEWNGQTRMYFEPANVDLVSQEGFSLIHGRVGFETGPWEVALWGKNLGDEEHCQNIIALTANRAGLCTIDAPRTWGLSLRRRF